MKNTKKNIPLYQLHPFENHPYKVQDNEEMERFAADQRLIALAEFGGVTLRLSDTAGIHTSGDAVEQIGMTRAVDEIEGAELILAVWSASEALTEHDRELIERLKNASAPVITVLPT